MLLPPFWGVTGQQIEAPSERTASCADNNDHSGSEVGGTDGAAACRRAEALEFVRVEDRGGRTAGFEHDKS